MGAATGYVAHHTRFVIGTENGFCYALKGLFQRKMYKHFALSVLVTVMLFLQGILKL